MKSIDKVYFPIDDLKAALAAYEKVLFIYKRDHGNDHQRVATTHRCPWRRGRFFKIHRGSGRIFFEDIEKVHEFDRIFVFTSETS